MKAPLTEKFADVIAGAYLKAQRENRRQQWYNFISRVLVYEEKLTKTFQNIFRQQKNEVLEHINTDYFFDVAIWNSRIESVLIKAFKELVENEGNIVLQQVLGKSYQKQDIDIGFDVANPYVRELIEGRALKLSPEINEETQKALRETLLAGHEAGESMPLLADRVKDTFKSFNDYRALRIARTETIRGSNHASEEAYAQSGVVEGKSWNTCVSERTCDDCIAMDGRTSELRKSFDTSGTEISLDYTDGEMPCPPAHVNCRCCIIPHFA